MRFPLVLVLLLMCAAGAIAQETGQAETEAEAEAQVAGSDDPDGAETAPSKVPLEEIRRYVAVFNAVKDAYVEPVEDKKLMQSAIRGLLLDLDPHSTYFDSRDAAAFDEQASGAYNGIGLELMQQPDNSLRVIAPIDGTPAARAGIKSGDLIIAIDGKPIDSSDGMEPLRGEPGTKLRLTLAREGRDKPFDVDLVRETIRVASVRSRMLEPGYGYVRISTFQADTGADFQAAIDALQAQGTLRGLVLDLRSNPGGLLVSAVQVADELLDKGNIVSTRGRIAISDSKFDATPGDRLRGTPVMVLVDAGSASASEVLAGALRDNDRARVIGSRTFGKGSVQTVLPLDNGDSVKLTTARYYTPSGRSIQASGIVPDVVLRPERVVGEEDGGGFDYSEASLPGHLRGDDEGSAGYVPGDVLEGDKPIEAALAELKKGAAAKAGRPAAGSGTVAPESRAPSSGSAASPPEAKARTPEAGTAKPAPEAPPSGPDTPAAKSESPAAESIAPPSEPKGQAPEPNTSAPESNAPEPESKTAPTEP